MRLLLIFLLPSLLTAQATLTYSIQPATGKIELDGRPTEAAWESTAMATDFQLQSPVDGRPAAEQTEVRLLYDERFLYVSAVCWDTNGFVVQTLKRDQPTNSDHFALWLDPVGTQTNGYGFAVTAWNGQTEALVSPNDLDLSWDQRWFSATHRGVDFWSLEMAIPLKSIRYKKEQREWRINFARIDPGTNESHVWSPVPRQFPVEDLGYYGELRWPDAPGRAGGNVSFIPYVRTSVDQDQAADPATTTDLKAGADAKIALSPTLNLDLTYNPDFSQVEVDRQVTNLTRFNIFFPERRQFFLKTRTCSTPSGSLPIRPSIPGASGSIPAGVPYPFATGYGLRATLPRRPESVS
ncbi:MAG: DUF5916 domain-containing protein [Bacteroidota bacterium]